MAEQIIEAGTHPAPHAADTAKIMVLAVHFVGDGIVISPIDVEHESDDQRDLSAQEEEKRKTLRDTYHDNEADMKQALGALYDIFDQRLYREKFRTFENFCFTMYGTHRIPDEVVKKTKGRVKKLKAELEGQE